MGRGRAVPTARSPEARPMVTSTARHWYHGDLQIYYVYYARASIYAFRGPRACPPAQNDGSRAVNQHMSRGMIAAMQILQFPAH